MVVNRVRNEIHSFSYQIQIEMINTHSWLKSSLNTWNANICNSNFFFLIISVSFISVSFISCIWFRIKTMTRRLWQMEKAQIKYIHTYVIYHHDYLFYFLYFFAYLVGMEPIDAISDLIVKWLNYYYCYSDFWATSKWFIIICSLIFGISIINMWHSAGIKDLINA